LDAQGKIQKNFWHQRKVARARMGQGKRKRARDCRLERSAPDLKAPKKCFEDEVGLTGHLGFGIISLSSFYGLVI
jgi:hypothetical protein